MVTYTYIRLFILVYSFYLPYDILHLNYTSILFNNSMISVVVNIFACGYSGFLNE